MQTSLKSIAYTFLIFFFAIVESQIHLESLVWEKKEGLTRQVDAHAKRWLQRRQHQLEQEKKQKTRHRCFSL